MNNIKKTEACKILQIKSHTLKNLTKSKRIIETDQKYVCLSSVLDYQKELEERRNISKPTWIHVGDGQY